jgi:hypothetical protein
VRIGGLSRTQALLGLGVALAGAAGGYKILAAAATAFNAAMLGAA